MPVTSAAVRRSNRRRLRSIKPGPAVLARSDTTAVKHLVQNKSVLQEPTPMKLNNRNALIVQKASIATLLQQSTPARLVQRASIAA